MDLKNKEQASHLVEQCIKGNRKSQKTLYKAFYGKMLGVCLRYSSDYNEAKDLVQDGFIKVFEKLCSYNHKGSLEGWIRRLIMNNTIDYLRKKKKMPFNYEEESGIKQLEDDGDEGIIQQKITQLKAEKIIELIQKLSPAYRSVFNLYVIEDYSHKEIAEMLGISIGTSKSNLAKAKQKLRELYKSSEDEFDETV